MKYPFLLAFLCLSVLDTFCQTPVPRKVLVEAFCSSTCPPCTPGNINLKEVLSDFEGDYARVDYQMSWPGGGDPYTNTDGFIMRSYYGINSIPMVFTDADSVVNSNSYSAGYIQTALQVPTYLQISPVEASAQPYLEYQVNSGQLTLASSTVEVTSKVRLIPTMNYENGLLIRMAIIEDTTYNNVTTNGETKFYSVMKKMLPDAHGTQLWGILSGDTHQVSENYMFVNKYRLPANSSNLINDSLEHSIEEWSDLSVVVWAQLGTFDDVVQVEKMKVVLNDPISNLSIDTLNGHVFYHVGDSTFSMSEDGLIYHGPLSSEGVASSRVSVYPTPASKEIFFKGLKGTQADVVVYSNTGNKVREATVTNSTLNVEGLPPGSYFLRIESQQSYTVEKIVIAY
ncbi:MAG: T9SS type A sorting domain-containing protein [Flavobacteriales bacterium]|nr:T9SS type A sorting domain-containing protein [Flavobacteriales bacterium]